jgi:hypothetical protein
MYQNCRRFWPLALNGDVSVCCDASEAPVLSNSSDIPPCMISKPLCTRSSVYLLVKATNNCEKGVVHARMREKGVLQQHPTIQQDNTHPKVGTLHKGSIQCIKRLWSCYLIMNDSETHHKGNVLVVSTT